MSAKQEEMNCLQFEVNFGPFKRIAVSWNSFGMLNRIEWLTDDKFDQFSHDSGESLIQTNWAPGPIQELVGKLKHYFDCGHPLGSFPWEWLDQSSWTPFQYQVYAWIAKIPHGETRTYGWVASRIGRPNATRAVGQALKNNPILIFIPCHRVIAANSLGGFLGAKHPEDPEIDLKKKLLELEQSYQSPSFSFMSQLLAPSEGDDYSEELVAQSL